MVSEMAKGKAWEQMEGEPDAAYARFLVYLSLGRVRSVDLAFQTSQKGAANRGKSRRGHKVREKASGTWFEDSSKYCWVERALAKDIDDLTGKGYETVIDFVNTLAILANKTLKSIANDKIRPRSLKSVLELVNILGGFIPAETVSAVRADAEGRRISALGRSDGHAPDAGGH